MCVVTYPMHEREQTARPSGPLVTITWPIQVSLDNSDNDKSDPQ